MLPQLLARVLLGRKSTKAGGTDSGCVVPRLRKVGSGCVIARRRKVGSGCVIARHRKVGSGCVAQL